MPAIKLAKQPGYIYDLLFVFYLKYNKEYCLDNFVNKKSDKDDKEFYEQILKMFSPISDDLYVFFHALKNGKCFVSSNYFDSFKNSFTSDFDISFLQKALSDYSEVVKQAIYFYFHALSSEDVEKAIGSSVYLFEIIKKSSYSDEEKSRLYEFFINPIPYIQKLQYELMVKELQLSNYYEKHYALILDSYNSLTFEKLNEQVKPLKDIDFIKADKQQLILSFCLLNKNCVSFISVTEGVVYLLGYDYVATIGYIKDRSISIKLDEFGSALAEESRVRMLDLMLEKGEISCKDLERIFNFSGSTAYHHLMTLAKYGVIKTRNEGKTILYSVNTKCFDVVIDVLSKYSSRKERS